MVRLRAWTGPPDQVIRAIRQLLPKRLQREAEPLYRSMHRRLAALDRAFDKRTISCEEFADLLGELGVTVGATVMVHSSMDEIARRVPQMTPLRAIQLLQHLLGREGTLLMPTFPFLGRQLDYVKTHSSFNPQKTPSQVGLITEIFRRMPGVIRSLHPTHPIAAWGKHARELISSHHLGTAFGEYSPLFKLQEFNGLVVGLGTKLRRFSILHVAEELHPKVRQLVFEATPRVMTIVDGSATRYRFYAMRSDVVRDYDRVEKLLLRDGSAKYLERNGLKCVVVQAERLIRRFLDLIDSNCYSFD
jgi:aminoglycoside 3-N-acetyltransferase